VQAPGDRIGLTDAVPYDRYVQAEWSLFEADPVRRSGVPGLSARRVLDIGCGAGQELRPFVRDASTLGIGIDISAEAGRAGRALFAAHLPDSHVAFARAAAESLPFPGGAVDLVICRLALPYTDNARALAEVARVLTPGGVLLLKFHHARYYVEKLREACAAGSVKPAIHACRVLLAGAWYWTTRAQPRNRFIGSETFQTIGMLRRELIPLGLTIRENLSDSDALAPSLLIVRERGSVGAAAGAA
jgi:SAM-dependent methyltransferase